MVNSSYRAQFISQFLTGSAYQRTASDLEASVLSFAEVKALALSDPRMRILSEKENELTNLLILNNKHMETQRRLETDQNDTQKSIKFLERQVRGTEENSKCVKDKAEDEYKLLRQIITAFLDPELVKKPGVNLGAAWGFVFATPEKQSEKAYFTVSRADVLYSLECGDSAAGNAVRVTNLLKGLPERLLDLKTSLEEKQRHLAQIKDELRQSNPYLDKINALKREVMELRLQIEE